MRILVTGATGFIGQRLVPNLRGDQHDVVTVSCGSAPAEANPASVDLNQIGTWPYWPADVDAVIHLSALNSTRNQTTNDAHAFRHANALGTQAIAARAAREGVRRFIFLSTANVHASSNTPIKETDPIAPPDEYSKSKLEGESLLWAALANSNTTGVVLRPAPVFGENSRGNLGAIIKLATKQLPLPIRGIGAKRSIIALDHLICAIKLCLSSDRAAGETFLVADPDPLTPDEIVSCVRNGMGRPALTLPFPRILLTAAAILTGKTAVIEALSQPFILDTSHARQALGFAPPDSAKEALRKLAASYTNLH